ncbi:endonuclease III [uncultured Rhodoblastus sp.]|uniref:endonuclease III n=1 Tax=uncultured Rhodoblastus sp. TaxID=543037 RepID=UPI0025D187FC|nr:endonuclease III [uncultured Rhodoblastus sp.]
MTESRRRPAPKSAAKSKAKPVKGPPKKAKPSTRQNGAAEPDRVRAIFAHFAALNPNPSGELEYINTFTLLVAVVLSAQATDAGVNRATRGLFASASTPQAMVALGEAQVREKIKTIGLFRAKARNVVALSRKLIDEFGGEVPRTREALESLPGVGRKTANVVLNIAFGEKTIAVDTHLFRVSNRIPLAHGATPEAVERGLLEIVPEEYLLQAHHWLILHGRYICKARKPLCGICPIADLCLFAEKTISTPPQAG